MNSFNSTLVRLKGTSGRIFYQGMHRFNSTLVRLKVPRLRTVD